VPSGARRAGRPAHHEARLEDLQAGSSVGPSSRRKQEPSGTAAELERRLFDHGDRRVDHPIHGTSSKPTSETSPGMRRPRRRSTCQNLLGEGVVRGEDRGRSAVVEQRLDPHLGVRRVQRDAHDEPLVELDAAFRSAVR